LPGSTLLPRRRLETTSSTADCHRESLGEETGVIEFIIISSLSDSFSEHLWIENWNVNCRLSVGATKTMLYYAAIFLVIAIIAGILGFWVVASTAAVIAKVLFVLFLVLFLVSLISGGRRV
jgi:uncharacterized membrane protein YtjA (UPF0391 family)